jgi:hypothetical protein
MFMWFFMWFYCEWSSYVCSHLAALVRRSTWWYRVVSWDSSPHRRGGLDLRFSTKGTVEFLLHWAWHQHVCLGKNCFTSRVLYFPMMEVISSIELLDFQETISSPIKIFLSHFWHFPVNRARNTFLVDIVVTWVCVSEYEWVWVSVWVMLCYIVKVWFYSFFITLIGICM